jgi:histone deacetylase 11
LIEISKKKIKQSFNEFIKLIPREMKEIRGKTLGKIAESLSKMFLKLLLFGTSIQRSIQQAINYCLTSDMSTALGSFKIPIVYHSNYNIHLYGLENVLHSFDSKKYGRVYDSLCKKYDLTYENFSIPPEINQEDLLLVHTQKYLDDVQSSLRIAMITEVPFLAFIPICIGRPRLLIPMQQATAGTILASQIALKEGWAINLSGGYHHAKAGSGGGFCIYADIPIAIRKLLHMKSDMTLDNNNDNNSPRVNKAMIVDLDAHQGNGYLSLFTKIDPVTQNFTYQKLSDQVAILDMYNRDNYPHDVFAKDFIDFSFPLPARTSDERYLQLVRTNLPKALEQFQPEIVFYNAGTDIFERDPLGALNITASGIIERDEIVFRNCRERHIPIVMVLSGGYTQESAQIISNSIMNLIDKKIISWKKE